MHLHKYFYSFLIVLLFSCTPEAEIEPFVPEWSQEESIRMNATFSAEETEAIDGFLSRRPDWKMTKTGTGLQYFIYYTVQNRKPTIGDIVWVNFSVSLLNNKVCYTSKRGQPESFMIEKSDIESGIHEGVQLMSEGESAKFILPSHLAHGLIGDLDQIPPMETVIYDVELVKIDPKNE